MAVDDTSRDELGAFLKARRAALTPEQLLLPETGQRRVKGLRREEVAELAFISSDYYRRLEQGRTAASAAVLDSLAEALRLDDDERAYLSQLTAETAPAPVTRRSRRCRATFGDCCGNSPISPRSSWGGVLDWNPLAAAVLVDFASLPVPERNYVRLTFTHPAMRSLYPDWEQVEDALG